MSQPDNPCGQLVCEQFPELERLNYCHGQMLSAQDFVDEQKYFLNKIALLTRCLQGYGVVCGLVVSSKPTPQQPSNEKCEAKDKYFISVSCGMAVDSRGREVVLRSPVERGLRGLLTENDRTKFDDESRAAKNFSLYLTIEYNARATREQPRPNGGCCGDQPNPFDSRWRDEPCIRLTFDCPPEQTCDSCCDQVKDSRIWLARLDLTGAELKSPDNTIRRPITTYQTTKISGTNWLHTGVYEEAMAECLLSTGLIIQFSAPIDPQSILNHEVKLRENKMIIHTNDLVEVAISDELEIHKNNPIQILQSRIETMPDEDGKVRRIRVRVETRRLAPPLRVLVTVRNEFIFDMCCQPIDGSNSGGLTEYIGWGHPAISHPVNSLEDTVAEHKKRFKGLSSCENALKTQRKESGRGKPSSNFQSWFYVVGDGCLCDKDPVQEPKTSAEAKGE